MIDLKRILPAITNHAKSEYPKESCGFVYLMSGNVSIFQRDTSQWYFPCENIHPNPTEHFTISPDDYLYCYERGDILAVVHSHPDGNLTPSKDDINGLFNSDVPWIIADCEGNFKFLRSILPFTGRQFDFGAVDCYTLIRDVYMLAGDDWTDYHRSREFWKEGQNLYLDNIERHSFRVDVNPDFELKPLDLILICAGSEIPTHGAIYIGENMILHHFDGRLSCRDQYKGYWKKYTHSVWRSKKWQQLDFTAICNALA